MAGFGGDEVTAITARPITAVPITARPITARRIGEGDGPSVRTLLSVALQSTLVPGIATGSGTPTYTRSTVATVTDFEGLVKNVLSGEARFMGARRVRNLWAYSSENFTGGGAPYLYGSATVSGRVVTATSTSAYGYMSTIYDLTVVPGTELVLSITTSGGTATGVTCAVRDQTNGAFIFEDMPITIGARSSRRFTVPSGCTLLRMYNFRGVVGTGTIEFVNVQLENVTGNANKNPSEYVSVGVLSAPYHGAGVDGVKYFTAKNGNTVSSNIVTEATGAAIGAGDYFADASGPFGYVAEGQRQNLLRQSQVFTDAGIWGLWSGGPTITGGFVSPDGSANATRINSIDTASDSVSQRLALTAGTHTVSFYVKHANATESRIFIFDWSGSGEFARVQFGWTGGVPSTNTSLAASGIRYKSVGNGWYRISFAFVAPTTGDYSVAICPEYTSNYGLGVYIWGAQLEAGSFPGTYIPTTTAAVTRNAGSGSYASSSNITTANGVMVLEWTPPYTGMGTVALWGSYVDANNYTRIFHDGTNIVFRRRVSGVNYDATKALTYAAGTTYKIAARISDATGGDVFVAGVKGTNSSNTSALQLGANFSVGHDGNGANHSFAPIRNVKHYDTALTDVQVAAI